MYMYIYMYLYLISVEPSAAEEKLPGGANLGGDEISRPIRIPWIRW